MNKSDIVRPYFPTVDKIVYIETDQNRCFVSSIKKYRTIYTFLKSCASVVSHPDSTDGNISIANKYFNRDVHPLKTIYNVQLSNGFTKNFMITYLHKGQLRTMLGSDLLQKHIDMIICGLNSDICLNGVTYSYMEKAVFIDIKTRESLESGLYGSSLFITCLLIPLMNYIPKKTEKEDVFSRESKTIRWDYLKVKNDDVKKNETDDDDGKTLNSVKSYSFCLNII